MKNKEYIFLSDIAKIHNTAVNTVRNRAAIAKVLIKEEKDANFQERSCVFLEDYEKIKPLLESRRKCKHCDKSFYAKNHKQLYCSKECAQKNAKDNYKKGTTEKNNIEKGEFAGESRSYAIKIGRAERKAMENCSTQCLIKELGDIE